KSRHRQRRPELRGLGEVGDPRTQPHETGYQTTQDGQGPGPTFKDPVQQSRSPALVRPRVLPSLREVQPAPVLRVVWPDLAHSDAGVRVIALDGNQQVAVWQTN